jgi:dTDP-glucose 4,6-dehydratase
MRVVIAGGAGLIGSHLAELLIERGDEVLVVDDYSTGRPQNLSHLVDEPGFSVLEADVTEPFDVDGPVDAVCNLASPASPTDFSRIPLEILRAGSAGTFNTIELARRHGARYLLASTSEVYGEPMVHPQPESYWGNVNTVGPRACYDESKRFAEAVTSTYARSVGVDTAIARIFNTYGPRMRVDDGRVVSNFVVQALTGQPLTLHGDGRQTRSFCYVEDEVRGLAALLDSTQPGPVNIGNPVEFTVEELAHLVLELTGSDSEIVYRPLPQDDPSQRRPDITVASLRLGWQPTIPLREGLQRTIEHFRAELDLTDSAVRLDGGRVQGTGRRGAGLPAGSLAARR